MVGGVLLLLGWKGRGIEFQAVVLQGAGSYIYKDFRELHHPFGNVLISWGTLGKEVHSPFLPQSLAMCKYYTALPLTLHNSHMTVGRDRLPT